MTWAAGQMLAFDTETTGVDPEQARIVTACLAWIDGANNVTTQEWLVDPQVEIPAEATAVHGVTTEKARADGVHPATACAQIFASLDDAWSRGIPVVIMNAPFDLTILDRELRRHCGSELLNPGPVIDPYCIDKAVDKYRRGKRTLTDLCAHYEVRMDGAHTAAGDCLAAARVAWRLAQRYPEEVGTLTLDALHAKQQAWRAEWTAEFTDYLRQQGKSEVVDGSWPLRSVT